MQCFSSLKFSRQSLFLEHRDLRQVVTWVLLKLRLCQFMWCIGHSNYGTIKQSNLRTHQENVFPHGRIESEILLALEQFKFGTAYCES
jgi:hypothetical protein